MKELDELGGDELDERRTEELDELGAHDWERLAEMRADFLDAATGDECAGLADYWMSRRDLELYDRTFGARIGWKWQAVARELALRGIVPPSGCVLDWGCGTGVATRVFLETFGTERVSRVHLFDRSPAAREFACERVRAEHPGVAIADDALPSDASADVLLVSHVLAELDEPASSELLALARRARWIAWVEPGSLPISRRLSALRDELRAELEPLAPCTHAESCGMLVPGRERDWCHHFARPPAEVHQSRHWSRFARELGIDLRSLPYSFLVLARREDVHAARSSTASRILGRPRVEKASARIDACDRDGVHDLVLLKRESKELFKSLSEPALDCPIFEWRVEGSRIREPRRAIQSDARMTRDGAQDRAT
jgi:SAM-dependent methyltransferase